jgi:hypothetical protein
VGHNTDVAVLLQWPFTLLCSRQEKTRRISGHKSSGRVHVAAALPNPQLITCCCRTSSAGQALGQALGAGLCLRSRGFDTAACISLSF